MFRNALLSKCCCLLNCDYHCFMPSDFLHQNIPPLAAVVYLTTSAVPKQREPK